MEYEFKVNAPLNHSELKELFLLAFGRTPSSAYFDWKYFGSPEGKVVHATAWHQGKLVAFYGILPEILSESGSEIECYQSMDTMVHPDHQGQRLFTKLAKLCYDSVEDTDNIFGFAGANSTPGFVKHLDFSVVDKINYVYSLPWLIWALSFLHQPLDFYITTEPDFGPDLERFLSEGSFQNLIHRDLSSEKLRWRVINHPDKQYFIHYVFYKNVLAGFLVISNNDRRVTTLEYIYLDDNISKRLLPKVLLKISKLHKTRLFFAYESKLSCIRYSKMGFFRNKMSRGPFRGGVNFIVRRDFLNRNLARDVTLSSKVDLQPLMRD